MKLNPTLEECLNTMMVVEVLNSDSEWERITESGATVIMDINDDIIKEYE